MNKTGILTELMKVESVREYPALSDILLEISSITEQNSIISGREWPC